MKDMPQQPESPNPYTTAAAQTGSNVNTAIANAWLGNANEISPLGTVTTTQTGTQQVREARRDRDGNPVMERVWMPDEGTNTPPPSQQPIDWNNVQYDDRGNPILPQESAPPNGPGGRWVEQAAYDVYDIPTFTRETKLSPEQQALYDKQSQAALKLGDFANSQIERLSGALNTPFNLEGLPEVGDFANDRQRYEEALFARLNPQLQQGRSALETQLLNQGATRGSASWDRAMDEWGRQENDARLQAVMAGGAEQSRLYEMATDARSRAITERMAERNQPLNEVSALMSGSQVSMPQFQPYRASQVANTPVGDYVYQSANIDRQNWQTQMQAAAQTNAGIFGLGSTMLRGIFGMPFGKMA